ncbi:MAG TPA: serine/threonine-protein kinase [Chiayiivirga sp.]|nr:MAG: tetratricopeptide repeat protein [Ottowia sp.]HPA01271.1 serine/threonine-protein kinase [Chiayiivirga sp.]
MIAEAPRPGGDAARFARIEALLDAALDQPSQARQVFLEQACVDDPAMHREVLDLLAAVSASEGFLEAAPFLPQAAPAPTLGPWRLVRPIGRGGMGEVWLAERADGRFEQQVAIKLLHRLGAGEDTGFLREQRLLARLEHPGIARLLDAGALPDGRPYMVMEYVDGAAWSNHIRSLAHERRLALFLQVCDAVAFAHRHLVIHCDLKPENILVRRDGRVALLDFGIARRLDGEAGQTCDLRLTPRYAAPEQLSGEARSTLTDVYALGLLLHELLTDRSPWGELVGAGPIAMLQRARMGPPPPPSACAPSPARARLLRGDLDAIVSKALRPEPAARYASVEALAEDLRRHLAHRTVAARGDALGYRLRRLLRRYWVAAAAVAVVFVGLVAALSAISLAHEEALRERDIAQTEARRSKAVRDYLALMFRDAARSAGEGTPLTAKAVLDQAASRVAADFSADPATSAAVLKALGELHFHINDYAAAVPLLRRWLEHEADIADPNAAADVRFTLAEAVHRMGQGEEARRLLAAAQRYWETDPPRHADVLLTSRMLQARLQREDGDPEGALAVLEAALRERRARSGDEHYETAALLTNLGAAYVQSGRLDEGIDVSRRALALWERLQLGAGNDALNTLNNLAAAYFRKNDLERAEETFARALDLRRTLFGPSAATAALIGNYARVLQRLGRWDEALALGTEAEAMALAHAGSSSLLVQAMRVARAETLLALGQPGPAREALEAFSREDPAPLPVALRLRAALGTAEAAQRQKDRPAAADALAQAERLLGEAGAEAVEHAARLEALRRALPRP